MLTQKSIIERLRVLAHLHTLLRQRAARASAIDHGHLQQLTREINTTARRVKLIS